MERILKYCETAMVAEFITPNYNLFVTMKKPNKIKRTTVAGSKKNKKEH